jgi:menaquinol-cytochrome c reductase cytochrome b/c subunit
VLKWSMFTVFIVACALAVVLSAKSIDFNASGSKKEVAVATLVDGNSEGAKIFQKATCVTCHGTDLKGNPAGGIPKLLGVGDIHDKAGIAKIIKEGFKNMPAQYDANIEKGLTAADLDKLATWLSTQKAPAAKTE